MTGDPLSVTDLVRLTGASETEVAAFIADLERNGVFSRDRSGRIYSRRMVKDARNAAINKKNGKNGGNPNLCKNRDFSSPDNPPVKPPHKAHKPSATSTSPIKGESRLAKRFSNLELRESALKEMDEPWVASWLDQCQWRDLPTPCIVAPHEFAAKKVREGLRRLPPQYRHPVIVELAA